VLDDVEGSHQIECFLLKGQAVGARLRHLLQPAVVAVADGFQVHVDALRISESREVGQHGSGATAIEDPAMGIARAEVPVEEREQDAPAADEPPVDVLHLVVLPVELSLQSVASRDELAHV
jgi:hypothetical protein